MCTEAVSRHAYNHLYTSTYLWNVKSMHGNTQNYFLYDAHLQITNVEIVDVCVA